MSAGGAGEACGKVGKESRGKSTRFNRVEVEGLGKLEREREIWGLTLFLRGERGFVGVEDQNFRYQ
jgi:hypothetical protein